MIMEFDIQQGWEQITGPCRWYECGPILAMLLKGEVTGENITDDFDLGVTESELAVLKSPSDSNYSLTLGSIISRASAEWGGKWLWAWNQRDGGIIAYCEAQLTETDKEMLKEAAHG